MRAHRRRVPARRWRQSTRPACDSRPATCAIFRRSRGTIKEIIDQGLLGAAGFRRGAPDHHQRRLARSESLDVSTGRAGGGIFHWLGCHWLDLFRWTTRSEVTIGRRDHGRRAAAKRSTSRTWARSRSDTTTAWSARSIARYITDPGSGDEANQWFIGVPRHDRLDQMGTGGTGHPSSQHPPRLANRPTRTLRFDADKTPGYGGATGVFALRQFIGSCRDNIQPPFTPYDALRVLETLDAAGESSPHRPSRHAHDPWRLIPWRRFAAC